MQKLRNAKAKKRKRSSKEMQSQRRRISQLGSRWYNFIFSSETPLGHFSKLPQWCLTEKIHFRSCICVFRGETPLGQFPKLPQWCLRPKSHFWSCIFKTTKKETLTLKQTQRDIQPPRKQKDDDMTIIQMNPRKDTYILTLTPKKTKNPKFGDM